jgi:tryptophan-rich sensory protein
VAGIAVAVAVAGGLATETGPWYQALRKPEWQPPGWVFGPVWTTIFALAAVATTITWRAAPDWDARWIILLVFGANAVLNILWSVAFFTLRRPDWAMMELVLLWLSIAAMIAVAARFSMLAALLLVPYIVWVSIAGMLNRAILRLNGPFGGG